MPLTRLTTDQGRMVITTSQSYEQRNSGAIISNERSIRWTFQSAWRYSKSAESWKLEEVMMITFSTPALTLLSPENTPSKIGQIWMLTRSPKGQWCDYCKMRWGVENWRGQIQAVWQITTKRHNKVVVRHYCHACALEVQEWTDGVMWSLNDQIQYAKGQATLDVQP